MMFVNIEHGNPLTTRNRIRTIPDMSSTTWKTLLARLSDRTNKDWQEHWRTFVEIYRPLLTRYVRSIAKTYGHTTEEAEVEEVVQDIFIRLSMVMSPVEMTNGHSDARTKSSIAFARESADSSLYPRQTFWHRSYASIF